MYNRVQYLKGMILLFLLFGTLQYLFARENQAVISRQTIRAMGVSAITDNNVADARRAALRDAQRNAVEQACGVLIGSESQVSHFQLLHDKIYSRASGFITDYTVKEEGADGAVYTVEILAALKVETLRQELMAIGLMLAEQGFPKIMLIVDEMVVKGDESAVVTHPALTAEIENTLLEKGFVLVAREHSDKLRLQERDLMAEVIADDQKAADMALAYGAEVIVVGENRITDLGVHNLFHQADATASVRAIIAATAQVVSSVKETRRGASDTAENARTDAGKKAGEAVAENLVKRIVQNWQQIQERGTHYSVKLYGIESYRNQAMAFISLLKAVPGISDVQQRSYGGGRLELDVRYNQALDELVAAIWDRMSDDAAFDSVDQKEAIGTNLIFEFTE